MSLFLKVFIISRSANSNLVSCLDDTKYSFSAQHHDGFIRLHFNTGRFIMFSVITNIYNKKIKGSTLMEFFTATGKLEKFFS